MELQNHPGSYLMDPLTFCNSKEDHLTIKEQKIMKATNCMITLRLSSHLEFVATTECFEFLCVFKRHFWLRYNLHVVNDALTLSFSKHNMCEFVSLR